MAHTQQERYSALVDLKMRATLVTKDGVIFNNRYEGNPKAGAVKIPVRDTEVTVAEYDKMTGVELTHGSTAYLTLPIDKDYAVNELIDGFDAATVPDNLVADRLDSAGYSLALQLDKDGIATLESEGTAFGNTTAVTKNNIYETFVDLRTAMSEANIPGERRFAIVSPAVFALVLKSPEFISASNLGDTVKVTGAQGRIAGFNVYECNNLSPTTEIIAGHPDWCTRVSEWQVAVQLQSLAQSGKFIGASAVQGRKIYAHKITKPIAVQIKSKASA